MAEKQNWLVEQVKQADPNRLAIKDARSQWSYKQLYEQFGTLPLTLKPGMRGTSYLMDQTADSAALLLAILESHMPVLPLDWQLTQKEIQDSIHKWGIYGCISRSSVERLLNRSEGRGTGMLSVLSQSPPTIYQLTSGSGGISKLAVVPHSALFLGAQTYRDWFGFEKEDIILAAVPLNYSFGMVGALLGSIAGGAACVPCRATTISGILRELVKHHCTIMFTTPLCLQLMSESSLVTPDHLGSLRMIISSGDYLHMDTREKFKRKFDVPIYQVYGSTESGAVAAERSGVRLENGSVGSLLPGVEVRTGSEGQLYIKSRTNFIGYMKDNGIESAVGADGFFKIGDQGRVQNGQLYLAGRKRGDINVAGRKVSPVEVEQALLSCIGVVDAKVSGRLDRFYGEKIVAWLRLKEGQSLDEVKDELTQLLARYKHPHVWEVTYRPEVWKKFYRDD